LKVARIDLLSPEIIRQKSIDPADAAQRENRSLSDLVGEIVDQWLEQLGAPFWTVDRRLVNSASTLNLDWVHWVGEA